MTSVPRLRTCHADVTTLHLLKLLQHSNLSLWSPLVHKSYGYDALMLFALCYVYFDAMPLVAIYLAVACLFLVLKLTSC